MEKTKKTIQEAVAEQIIKRSEGVAETVIEMLAGVEISKRVDSITKAIQKQDQLERDYKKINKNDITTYVNGEQVESMSKNRFDEIKKSREALDSLTKTIDLALTQNSNDAYNKLFEILKKNDNGGANKAKGESDSE